VLVAILFIAGWLMKANKDTIGTSVFILSIATLFGFLFPLSAQWILLVILLIVIKSWIT